MANILLVEDDQAMCSAVQRALEQHGHAVTLCQSSIQAWDAIREPCDVLVTGLIFPQNQPNGVALSRHAHRQHKNLSVIFITALDEHADDLRSSDEIAFMKPFDVDELVQAITIKMTPLQITSVAY